MGETSVRALSLLRERFEDEGDGGTCSELDDMLAPDLMLPISLALRLRARSLCSLKGFGAAPSEAAGSGDQNGTSLRAAARNEGRGRDWRYGKLSGFLD